MGTELSDNKKVALISGITGQVLKRFLGQPEFIFNVDFLFAKRMVRIWPNYCCPKGTLCTVSSEDQVRSILPESNICMIIQKPIKREECICTTEI